MELLSPAGSIEKLKYAFAYGADAAYLGVQGFSLRANAENAAGDDFSELSQIKGNKKLYGAINLFPQDDDLDRLAQFFERSSELPFDAWIVSDLGAYSVLRRYRPKDEVHLSTQANCLNSEAAKMYRDMGFARIIPGRELSLRDIARIKNTVPELAIEAFVHGAMCMAWSGRCFLSAELTGRSANRGDCAHTCRWDFRALAQELPQGNVVVEEKERPGEYFPIFEENGYTAIFSSKDLNMVRHLRDLRDAGVDSLKIEGRMKSLYYVSIVTRAYRRALDEMNGIISQDALLPYIEELERVSHRDYSTGFFYDQHEMDIANKTSYESTHRFLGTVSTEHPPLQSVHEKLPPGTWKAWKLELLNKITKDYELEIIEPHKLCTRVAKFYLADQSGKILDQAVRHKEQYIYLEEDISSGAMLRVASKGLR